MCVLVGDDFGFMRVCGRVFVVELFVCDDMCVWFDGVADEAV